MPISLSHLGEVILAEMADRKRYDILRTFGLDDAADLGFVDKLDRFAFPERHLAPHGGYSFDGASRIDVTFWIRPKLAVACELKLGKTRLNKSRVDDEFLANCRLTHNNSCWGGNMMAILDRRFSSLAPVDGLSVVLGDEPVPLSRNWFVVVRRRVLDRWKADSRPTFSEHTTCISINTIVDAFGGKDPFNALVKSLVAFDYYDKWIGTRET